MSKGPEQFVSIFEDFASQMRKAAAEFKRELQAVIPATTITFKQHAQLAGLKKMQEDRNAT